ncbi:MAG: AarF/ABC1/UbiB kinase family protein, partial [Candidatus Eremiobacteraeota bacterium]|nr:AarF/ABC1/UbiB kinase family protein [Candidatus Eremiobacteraeota bacterium]
MDTVDRAPSRAERYRQIVAVLIKYGIAAAGSSESSARADQLRVACEELGPTFIKLGQMLATRGDILPPEYRSELEKLQDSVAPLDSEFIVREIEDQLGQPIDELFISFDRTALASASIGQVHAARLPDGRDVVVKVRKPNVRELLERDLDILLQLSSSSQRYFPYLKDYDLRGTIEEFGDMLRAELDYRLEARNIDTFREILKDREGIELPETILQYSTANVLTLTRVEGARTSAGLPQSLLDREAAAQRLATFMLEPALVHGIFHGDPHGGNVLIKDDGRISVVDLGMVGRLSEELRRRVADLVLGFGRGDVDRVTDRLITIAPSSRPLDRGALLQQVNRMMERSTREAIGGLRMGQALSD